MIFSIDKIAIDYMVSKEQLDFILDYFRGLGCITKQWSSDTSPYFLNASIRDEHGDGLFMGYHIKRMLPSQRDGVLVSALRIQFNPSKVDI